MANREVIAPIKTDATPMASHGLHASAGDSARKFWLRWLPTFAGFIAGGAVAGIVAGPVADPLAAIIGGTIAGAVIGGVQWLALRPRLPDPALWIAGTAIGQGLGLTLGAALVDYRTELPDLVLQGAFTGLAVGLLQALSLRKWTGGWYWWGVAAPVLWAMGWIVTTLSGVGVDRQFTNFGATGAIVFTLLSGLLMERLLPRTPHAGGALEAAGGIG
jgi:hypothetical protein